MRVTAERRLLRSSRDCVGRRQRLERHGWHGVIALLLLLLVTSRSISPAPGGCLHHLPESRRGVGPQPCASSSQRPPPALGEPWTRASACHIGCLPVKPTTALVPSLPPPPPVTLSAGRACSSLSSTSKPPEQPWRPRRGSAPAGRRCWLSRRLPPHRHDASATSDPGANQPALHHTNC